MAIEIKIVTNQQKILNQNLPLFLLIFHSNAHDCSRREAKQALHLHEGEILFETYEEIGQTCWLESHEVNYIARWRLILGTTPINNQISLGKRQCTTVLSPFQDIATIKNSALGIIGQQFKDQCIGNLEMKLWLHIVKEQKMINKPPLIVLKSGLCC